MEMQQEDVKGTLLDHEMQLLGLSSIDLNLSESLEAPAPTPFNTLFSSSESNSGNDIEKEVSNLGYIGVDYADQVGTEGEAGHWLHHTFHMQGRLGSAQGYSASSTEGHLNTSSPNQHINALPENDLYQYAFTLSPILDFSNRISPPTGSNEPLLPPPSLAKIPFSREAALLAFDPSLQRAPHDVFPTTQQVVSLDGQILLPGIQNRNGLQHPTTAFQPGVSYSPNGLSVIGNYNDPVLTEKSSNIFQDMNLSIGPLQENTAVNDCSQDLHAPSPFSKDSTIPIRPITYNPVPKRRALQSGIRCLSCPASFTRPSDLTRHLETQHTDRKPCVFCDRLMVIRRDKYKDHLVKWHKMHPDVANTYSRKWC